MIIAGCGLKWDDMGLSGFVDSTELASKDG